MQCVTITKGVTLSLNWVTTLIYRPMNITTSFDSKQINLLLIQLVVKHPYFVKDFIVNWVRLSTLHPLNTFSRFNNNDILLKPSTTYVCTLHQDRLSIAITSSQLIIMYMAFCTSIMWWMLSTILPINGVRPMFVKNGFSPSRYQRVILHFHQMVGQVSRTKIWQQIKWIYIFSQ